MNAALRATVRMALYHKIEVFGAINGFYGLIREEIVPLSNRDVGNIIQRGGTILKTGRCPEFREKSTRDQVRAFLKKQQVDGLVVLGGDGSFRGATLLEQEGGPCVVGLPCTIDNDINGSEYTIGFDTARNTALEAIDKIRDTAFSLDRHFMIEVMGRSSGFLAVDVGIAGGAEYILTPEFPISIDALCKKLKNKTTAKQGSIMVVAEADKPAHSIELAKQIKEKTGIDYRVCILGHIQRGGSPTVQDRVVASLMGAKAIEVLLQKQSKMIATQAGEIIAVDFPDPNQATRYFSKKELLEINAVLCEV